MNVRRLFVIGIAFVAMSMFGSVQAGFTIEKGKQPVYTTDGTSTPNGATFEVEDGNLEFTVEKTGTDPGKLSGMEMDIGGCTYKISYTVPADVEVGIGGSTTALKSSITATASGSGVTYGSDHTPGVCANGPIKFAKVDDTKSNVVVKFNYDDKDNYPPLKFTFTNVLNATSNEKPPMSAGEISGIVCSVVVALLFVAVGASILTWRCCWCECCFCNDPKQFSKWNKKKQERMKALGLDKKGNKILLGDAPGMKTAVVDEKEKKKKEDAQAIPKGTKTDPKATKKDDPNKAVQPVVQQPIVNQAVQPRAQPVDQPGAQPIVPDPAQGQNNQANAPDQPNAQPVAQQGVQPVAQPPAQNQVNANENEEQRRRRIAAEGVAAGAASQGNNVQAGAI
ncbi:hypothetical protein M3Y94_00961800 [Aphelenchoides besseyi]|nr:hypothetical protein M3Y94_00961800 [Aphelenchoides besseyi]KAI6224706.1 hypothetical protein M3Y95_00780800 [Aphelenchoides besseyi]